MVDERQKLAASEIGAMLLAELKKLPSLQDTQSVRIRPHCGPEEWTWMLDRVEPELQPVQIKFVNVMDVVGRCSNNTTSTPTPDHARQTRPADDPSGTWLMRDDRRADSEP